MLVVGFVNPNIKRKYFILHALRRNDNIMMMMMMIMALMGYGDYFQEVMDKRFIV